ncbi:hypothetical protein ACIBUR_09420 [Streptomyces anulatus]
MASSDETDPLQMIMSSSLACRKWLTAVTGQFASAGTRVREETALAEHLDASDGALEEALIAVREAMLSGTEAVAAAARDAKAGVQAEVDKVCALLGVEEAPYE